MNIVVMAILVIVIGIGVAFGIYIIENHSKNKSKRYKRQGKNILVQDGIDVKRQILGSEKGAYFTGNLEHRDTSFVNVQAVSLWQIYFCDIDNSRRYHFCFQGHMWIGRTEMHPGEATLVLPEDRLVSKTHCMIYELEGRLCLNDMQSKNHTYMNGIKVTTPTYLENQCILKVGDTKLKVQFMK